MLTFLLTRSKIPNLPGSDSKDSPVLAANPQPSAWPILPQLYRVRSILLNHPPITLINRHNGTFAGNTVAALSTISVGPSEPSASGNRRGCIRNARLSPLSNWSRLLSSSELHLGVAPKLIVHALTHRYSHAITRLLLPDLWMDLCACGRPPNRASGLT